MNAQIAAKERVTATGPRELSPGLWWLPQCVPTGPVFGGQRAHLHASQFLMIGTDATLLYDVGFPSLRSELNRALDIALAGRPLDWVIPSHPELPHSGDLDDLVRRHPGLRIGGDVRDYHLYLPEHTDRLTALAPGEVVDLGGGHEFLVVAPLIKDIPNTVWGYETLSGTLFTADGIAYTHHPAPLAEDEADAGDEEDDDTFHLPGECLLTSTELEVEPSLEQAEFVTRTALSWTRLRDSEEFFDQIDAFADRHPIRAIAPTHGNVVTNPDAVLPVIREAHRLAFLDGSGQRG